MTALALNLFIFHSSLALRTISCLFVQNDTEASHEYIIVAVPQIMLLDNEWEGW